MRCLQSHGSSPWTLDRNQRGFCLPLMLGYLPGLCIGLGWLLLRSDIGSAGHTLPSVSGLAHGVFTWPNANVLNARAASFVKMWVWAVPCLFVFAALGVLRHRENPKVRLLAASAVLTFVGYLFVTFDQGHGWGYRYFHSAWGVIRFWRAARWPSGRDESQSRFVCWRVCDFESGES